MSQQKPPYDASAEFAAAKVAMAERKAEAKALYAKQAADQMKIDAQNKAAADVLSQTSFTT